jgi:hypothetical protein
MMRKDQAEVIMKEIGSVDGPGLVDKLNALGVGENLELTDVGISIPKAVVADVSNLQSELSSLSKEGRAFEITEEGEKLVINTLKMKPSFLSKYSVFPQSTGRYASTDEGESDLWGIREEHVKLPIIARGSKVLDVGAGTSFIAEEIRDTLATVGAGTRFIAENINIKDTLAPRYVSTRESESYPVRKISFK